MRGSKNYDQTKDIQLIKNWDLKAAFTEKSKGYLQIKSRVVSRKSAKCTELAFRSCIL